MPEISAARYRAGQGEPVVLIHGFTATWLCWKPLLADLVARYDVLAPTLHGHDGGPAITPGQAHDLPAAADHLERALEEQGIGTAHLVGNSLGGALSLELAKRGRARSVVAISPGGGWAPGSPEEQRIMKFFKRQLRMTRASVRRMDRIVARPSTRRLALRDVMCRGELVQPADAAAMARSSLRCEVVEDVFKLLGSSRASVMDLDQVAAPTLVAWAENDRILPLATCAARYRTDIPGAEFRVLPAVGHVPMWDDTKLVVDTVVDWVDRHATGEPAGHAAAEPAAA